MCLWIADVPICPARASVRGEDSVDFEAGPTGSALQGRDDFRELIGFASSSKRSNAPGLRSGSVTGDARLLRQFLLHRAYHGCAMSLAAQHASIAAWGDEAHGVNTGRGQVRVALVPEIGDCVEASGRRVESCR